MSDDGTMASLPTNFEYVDDSQLTPVMHIASSRQPQAARILREAIQNFLCPSGDGNEAYDNDNSDSRFVQVMLDQRDESNPSKSGGYAAIHYATTNGNHDCLKVLLDAGADPNLIKNNGCTALHSAIAAAGYERTRRHTPIEDFLECIDVLLRHPKFCLLRNDRHDDDEIAAKVIENEECVHHDGRGTSPVWLCVNQHYSDADVLLPFLKLMLARGFDVNGSKNGLSAVYMALKNGHIECAVVLVRAGASITDIICEETNTTVIGMAELNYSEVNLPRRLKEAAVVASIVGDTHKRRDDLRHDYVKGARKLAKRAMENGETMMKKGSFKEAAGLLEEALSFNSISQSFTMSEVSTCMYHLSASHLQCNQVTLAEDTARNTLEKFPNNLYAMMALGNALSHPTRDVTSPENWNEVENLAKAATAVLMSPNTVDVDYQEQMISNIKYLHSQVAFSRKIKSRAIQMTEIAMKEHNEGNFKKAVVAIDIALRPELEHPNPSYLRSLKGSINFDLAAQILKRKIPENKTNDKDNIDCDCDTISKLLNQWTLQDWNVAEEKIKIALKEFEYCRDNNDKTTPIFVSEWNVAISLICLRRLQEGSKYALSSIQMRQKMDQDQMNGYDEKNTISNISCEMRNIDSFLHVVKISKVLLQQEALERMKLLLAATSRASAKFEEMDSNNFSVGDLVESVKKAVSLEIIEQSWADDLLEFFETDCNNDDTKEREIVAKVLYEAIDETNKIQVAIKKLKADAASLIMETVLSAHQNRKENDVHKSVMGAMINDALEWDASVTIPSDLQKIYQKISKGCHRCGKANPSKTCPEPCRVAFCSKQCQLDSWKEHKKTCPYQKKLKKEMRKNNKCKK